MNKDVAQERARKIFDLKKDTKSKRFTVEISHILNHFMGESKNEKRFIITKIFISEPRLLKSVRSCLPQGSSYVEKDSDSQRKSLQNFRA